MNDLAPHSTSTIPAIGAPFGGGFFGGLHPTEPNIAIVVAPKAEGEAEELTWGPDGITTARSLTDGFANSEALNDEDHPAAQFCRSLRIGGHDDWYLPALDEMTVLRRNLMPGTGYVPEQTTAEAFREGGPEAFEREWYWTSTEFSKGSAWLQDFTSGDQISSGKVWSTRVRAVRKCQL